MGIVSHRASCGDNTQKSILRRQKIPKKLINSHIRILQSPTLKSIALDILSQYKENFQLSDYIDPLQKYFNEYDFSKLATFLNQFYWFDFLQKEKKVETKLTPSKKTTESLLKPEFVASTSHSDENQLQNLYDPFKNDEFYEYFKKEISQEDNFFFELANFIGEIYAQNFHEELYSFNALIEQFYEVDHDIQIEFKIESQTKRFIQTVFERVQKDIRQLEDFLYNCLKIYLTEISFKNKENEPSDFSHKPLLSNLALDLLFSVDKCYETFFSMIRYHTIEEEISLHNSFKKLKGAPLERFSVDPSFWFKDEKIPYQNAIESLSRIEEHRNPYRKFQIIFQLRNDILTAINQYYERENISNNKSNLTGDDLLPLYTYCLTQSCNEKAKAHQIFIETFLDEELLEFDEQGYCFLTYVGAIDSLLSQKDIRESIKDVKRRMTALSKSSSLQSLGKRKNSTLTSIE